MIINDECFNIDCYALPLEGFDLVLGVQWLRALGSIVWDFDLLTMSFWWYDHQVTWQGLTGDRSTPRLHACSQEDIMDDLLREFAPIFVVSHGLPPALRHDHRIHLARTAPIVVRPYRYPQLLNF